MERHGQRRRKLARNRAPQGHPERRPGASGCDRRRPRRVDGDVRGDDPPRHRGAALSGKLRRVRGGAEAVNPPSQSGLVGPPLLGQRDHQRRGQARHRQGGGRSLRATASRSSSMAAPRPTRWSITLAHRRMQVFTNSFAIAEHLLHHSKNAVMLPGGTIYREQNIILSPFDNDVSRNFYARKMFMGAQGIGPHRHHGGRSAADPGRAEADRPGGRTDPSGRLVEIPARSSLILCPLDRAHTVITDRGIRDEDRQMLEAAGRRPRRRGGLVRLSTRLGVGRLTAAGKRNGSGRKTMSLLKKLALATASVAVISAWPRRPWPTTSRSPCWSRTSATAIFDAANKGAQEAAKELGNVDIIYTGPTKATPEGQIDIINQLVAQKVDAIAISANDTDALVPALKKAMAARHHGHLVRLWRRQGRPQTSISTRRRQRSSATRTSRWRPTCSTARRATSPSCRRPRRRPTRTPGST